MDPGDRAACRQSTELQAVCWLRSYPVFSTTAPDSAKRGGVAHGDGNSSANPTLCGVGAGGGQDRKVSASDLSTPAEPVHTQLSQLHGTVLHKSAPSVKQSWWRENR